MKLNIFISASRFADEREIIKNTITTFCTSTNHDAPIFHDCNEDDSTLREEAKQDQYNGLIEKNTDLFVAILNASRVGKYTLQEIAVAYNSYLKNGFPVCLIFEAKEPRDFESTDNDGSCEINELKSFVTSISQIGYRSRQELLKGITDFFENNVAAKDDQNPNNHFFSDYGPDDLNTNVLSQVSQAYNKGRFFLRKYSRLGADIAAEEIMGNRATTKYGYNDNIYIARNVKGEVDYELASNINGTSNQKSISIVYGKPGAGKSRAIVELIRKGALKDKNIILINDTWMLNALLQTLYTRNQQGIMERRKSDIGRSYYFIIDNAEKLISDETEKITNLLNAVVDDESLYLYITITSDGYQNCKQLHIFQELKNNILAIEIQPLKQNNSRDAIIIKQCHDHYGKTQIATDTIGGYNAGLRTRILECLKEYTRTNTNDQYEIKDPVFRHFAKACFLLKKYRRNSCSKLGFLIKTMTTINNNAYNGQIVNFLNALIDGSILNVTENLRDGNAQSGSTQITTIDDVLNPTTEIVDGETIDLQISLDYDFEIDDLIWQAICETNTIIKYTQAAQTADYISTFGENIQSHRKIITRAEDKNAAWGRACKYLETLKGKAIESPEEYEIFCNLLVEYAQTFEEAKSMIETLSTGYNFEVSGDTIAAILTHHKRGSEGVLEYADELIKSKDIKPTAYQIYRTIELTTKDFSEAFDFINSNNELLVADFTNGDDLKKSNVTRALVQTFNRCRSLEEIQKYTEFVIDKRLAIKIPFYSFHTIISQIKRDKGVLNSVRMHLLGDDPYGNTTLKNIYTGIEYNEIAGGVLGCFLFHAPTFEQTLKIFQMMKQEHISSRTLSQLFGKCKKEEQNFRLSLAELNKCCESGWMPNLRTYNALIQQAPNFSAAMEVVNIIPQDNIDDFTLHNTMKVLQRDSENVRQGVNYLDLIKKIIPEINDDGVIVGESIFKGIKLDAYTYNIIMGFDNAAIDTWFNKLMESSETFKDRVKSNSVYYACMIKHTSTTYEEAKGLINDYITMIEGRTEPQSPDVINSFMSKIIHTVKVENQLTNEKIYCKTLLEQNKEKYFTDKYFIKSYFMLYSEELFDKSGENLSDTFKTKFENAVIDQLEYPFGELIRHGMRGYKEKKKLYELFIDFADKQQIQLSHYNNMLMLLSPLLEVAETTEQVEQIDSERKRVNARMDDKFTKLFVQKKISLKLLDYFKNKHTYQELIEEVKDQLENNKSAVLDKQTTIKFVQAAAKSCDSNKINRDGATHLLKDLIETYGNRITLDTTSYNYLLRVYATEEEKKELYKQMTKKRITPNVITYVMFINDWACSIETKREFYGFAKDVKTPETICMYLQQELTYTFTQDLECYIYVYNAVEELYNKNHIIDANLFTKLEKSISYDLLPANNNQSRRSQSVKEFIFNYIFKKLETDEQRNQWGKIAIFNGVDIGNQV